MGSTEQNRRLTQLIIEKSERKCIILEAKPNKALFEQNLFTISKM